MNFLQEALSLGIQGIIRRFEHNNPSVAMKLFDALAKNTADPERRAQAALGALRCAVQENAVSDILNFTIMWPEMRADPSGALAEAALGFTKRLVVRGHLDIAIELAKAEVERKTSARSLYLYARLLDRVDARAAFEIYGRAAEIAEQEPAFPAVAVTARVRRIERLAMDPATCPQAALEAVAADRTITADPDAATPAQKLVIAAGLLFSPGRFARATGLSLLVDLGRTAKPEIAQVAIRAAAQHADRLAEGLSSVEVDRVGAALKHWPDAAQRDSALVRLLALVRIASARGDDRDRRLKEAWDAAPEIFPLLYRAQAVLAEGSVGSYASFDEAQAAASREASRLGAGPLEGVLRLASVGLDAIVAIRRGKPLEAASALQSAREMVGPFASEAPPPFWTAVVLGLGSRDQPVRDAALALAEVLVSASGVAPPPPSLRVRRFATLLRRAGRADLAVRTLRWAASAKDPSATQDLAGELARQGWNAALEGNREVALAALREARDLAQATSTKAPAAAASKR
ncbi:MAG TPA: hypothetical protein VE093_13765 [Polyangiaceae bacterium]|nr:hypothetical protein [Polyangiaceae bacterium]